MSLDPIDEQAVEAAWFELQFWLIVKRLRARPTFWDDYEIGAW